MRQSAVGDILVGAINGNVNDWVLVDISKSQVGSDDEFFGLES